MIFGRKKTLEQKISATIQAEFARIVAALERDHREYRHRLKLKERAQGALEEAEAEVRRLDSEQRALEKLFEKAHSDKDETALSEIGARGQRLERATTKAEKALRKARAAFSKADFDEAAEGFALKAKANISEDEVDRRVEVLEKTLQALFEEVRHDTKETKQALGEEYREPRFKTAEERAAHGTRMREIEIALTESYHPGE
jgi:hypothetical protein